MKTKLVSMLMICFVTLGVTAQIDRSKQPQPGPAPTINLGQPDSFTLKNGLRVLVVENNKLPRVTASLILDNDPHSENEKAGLGSLTGAVLGNGTKTIAKEAYLEEVDFLGANVSIGAESAFASSLSKYFPRVLELMADGALNPLITETDFEAEKTKLIEGIKSNEKSVGAVASRVSSYLAYGEKHPYGEFATEETINNITFQDVKSYYDRYFVPSKAYLVIVGDIEFRDAKKLVKDAFGDWKKSEALSKTTVKPVNAQYTQVNFIDMPNAVQSELRLENTIDLQMNDEDYFSALVANQILGGSFGSYLNMNLREANGYTYGARSSIGADPYASRFVASTSVRNEVTDSAIVEMVKELRRIRTEPVSAQDLNNTKNKYAGNFVLQLENPATIANFALNIERYNLPKDFYKNYLKNINAVTMEDVQAAANKYVMVDNMRIVVAGKGKDVVEGLENLNLNGKKTPVFYFDKEGNKVDKPVYDKEIPEGVTAQTVYNSYLEAIGGKAKVEAVNTLSMTAGATMQGTPLELEIKKSKAGKMAQSLYVMGNVMSKQAFNGTSGYAMAQGQKVPYDEEQIAKGKTDALPFPELNLGEAKLVRIEAVDGSDAYVVMPSENVEDYYDVKSGLKVKSTQTRSQGAQTMVVTTLYKDYQEKEGIMFPMTISQSFGPQSIDFKVSNIVVNPEFTDSDFE